MAHLYLDPDLQPDCVAGDILTVRGPEARHAVSVARLQVGERTLIGNGEGVVVDGEVIEASRDELRLRIADRRVESLPTQRIVLVQALAKGDRDERAVEQATEYGVDEIVPWQAERSVSKWIGSEKQFKGRDKWIRVAREATKQSLRAWIPAVHPVADLTELVTLTSQQDAQMLVLDPSAQDKLSASVEHGALVDVERIILVVGPEGGLSKNELTRLQAADAAAVALGPTVMRTSSAGPAAIAVLSALLGRW